MYTRSSGVGVLKRLSTSSSLPWWEQSGEKDLAGVKVMIVFFREMQVVLYTLL